MKAQYLILPSIALGTAVTLFLPTESDAYNLLGGNLSTAQRDFRVFNNFTDPSANNNTTPDPNFPGFDGAELAIWKACIEWSSSLHGGTGAGDAHQPNGLGSGGANFDPVWAGNASSITTSPNDNIHAELSGGSGGVLAFCQTPISDGWMIRYYSSWTWQDGPGTSIGGGVDLQGVACHEYGHALGLDHSTTGSPGSTQPTMWPSIWNNGVQQRSIGPDDIAGVQAIYQVAAATKPKITSVSASPGFVTINGTNFGATGNQVWFTSNVATAPAGDPVVKTLNVNSNGTTLTAAVPANAGPGDVFVKLSTTGHASLSNGFPFDPSAAPPCTAVSNFCTAAPNSFSASGATTSNFGTQSVANNNLILVATGVPPNKLGLFFYGQDTSVFVPFTNGFRCVNNPFFRLPSTTADGLGQLTWPLNINSPPPGGQISAGETWGFQLWYRDPDAGGDNANASNGLLVPFCP